MAFPQNPQNNDVYIKDGLRYVYTSGSNSWSIQADPNKAAGNIRAGVSIDGINGTFPDDGTAVAGDVLADKTFYNTNGVKKTGTLVPTVSWTNELFVTIAGREIGYHQSSDGKAIVVTGIYNGGVQNSHSLIGNDPDSATIIASTLGKTINQNFYVPSAWTYGAYYYRIINGVGAWEYISGDAQIHVVSLITFN